jgi:cystathionine gamma-lyase
MTRILPHDLDHALGTRAVHAGQMVDPVAGAIMTPIYQTSTYRQDALGQPHNGYEYARTANPTREALERNVAALEGGQHGFAFASGLAALDTVLKLLKHGDHVVCGDNMYGGSHRLMEQVFRQFGLTFSYVDMRDPANVDAAITPATRMIYCETPTNPMMFLVDLAAIGDITTARGLLFVVDNTFATPVFQRPLEFGADVVLHSTTKYLNGHSDMVGGMLVTNREDLAERLGFLQNAAGGVPGPDGLLPGFARHQDPAPADETARRQWTGRGRVAQQPRRRGEIVLPWPAVPPAARVGQAPDERLRRHALLRRG